MRVRLETRTKPVFRVVQTKEIYENSERKTVTKSIKTNITQDCTRKNKKSRTLNNSKNLDSHGNIYIYSTSE